MTSNLHAPNRPPGAVIGVDPDTGVATRNDGQKLRPAAKNPWYVLATIAGELTGRGIDGDLHRRNRRYWNGWACAGMDEAAREDLAGQMGLEPEDLAPLSKEEWADIEKEFAARLGPGVAIPARSKLINFSETHFPKLFCLARCVLQRQAYFGSATFSGQADFTSATFSGLAQFRSATFSEPATFRSATFSDEADFPSATFSGSVLFQSASFSGRVGFTDARFGGTTLFTDARFRGEESGVPTFYQCSFHQDTDFTTEPENWPPVTADNAAESKRAYTRLRQVMNELHKPDAEAFFGRQELRCDAETNGRVFKLLSRGYGLVSDYGHSIMRPAAGLAGMIAAFWPVYVSWLMHGAGQGNSGIWQGLGLSIANSFPYLGFQRLYFDLDLIREFPAWLKLIGGVQTVAGGVLLFLLLLGLRNRFRLR